MVCTPCAEDGVDAPACNFVVSFTKFDTAEPMKIWPPLSRGLCWRREVQLVYLKIVLLGERIPPLSVYVQPRPIFLLCHFCERPKVVEFHLHVLVFVLARLAEDQSAVDASFHRQVRVPMLLLGITVEVSGTRPSFVHACICFASRDSRWWDRAKHFVGVASHIHARAHQQNPLLIVRVFGKDLHGLKFAVYALQP